MVRVNINETQTSMNVILADDHALFREGMRHLLLRLDDEVSILEADSHDAALKLLAENPDADLALIDLHMPGRKDDLSGLAEIIERAKVIPVVVLSGTENMDDIHQAIKAGAMGFIPKHEHAEVMLCALNLVLSGGVYIPPLLMSPATGDRQARSCLTARQIEVLRLMCKGYQNKEIGKLLKLSDSTIKCHMSAILRALDVDGRVQAAEKAKQLGLVA
jgi:DNA-binding NarL/FixJ family response regulator